MINSESSSVCSERLNNEINEAVATVLPAAAPTRRSLMNMMVSAAALTAAAATYSPALADDSENKILSLASEILRLTELVHRDDDEIIRLQNVWTDEHRRLREETELPAAECWKLVKAMPESTAHTKLIKKAAPYFVAADELTKHLWSIPATTQQGKTAKVRVLFETILGDEWKCSDAETDWHIETTRKLLFELAGVSGDDVIGNLLDQSIDHAASNAALLWADRQIQVDHINQLYRKWQRAHDELPAWATMGPRLIAHDGTYCGAEVGWPMILDVRPPDRPGAYRICRISPQEIRENFDFAVRTFAKSEASRAEARARMRASMRKLVARLRAQRAERARLGLNELGDQRETATNALFEIEDKIRESRNSADAKAARILMTLSESCFQHDTAEDDSEMNLACIALELLQPQLTGLIAEHTAFFLSNRTTALGEMPFSLI